MSELRQGVFTDVFQNISKQIPNGVPLMGKNTLDLELYLFIISITIIKKIAYRYRNKHHSES